MTSTPIRQPITRVRVAGLGDDDGLTDGQLLGKFVEERDEAALAALVRQLGPVVLGVCRRVIGDAHLAEDAFQAVFLVLVRRAAVIAPREQVRSWVYGVAYRVARRVRAVRARRQAKEQPVSVHTSTAPQTPESDLLPVLDEELAKLPEHYRAAILACDLEGRTRKEAAARLGIPDGTLSNRLAAARKMLARRLTRRGVTLALPVLLSASATARVSAALVDTTVRFAVADAPAGAPAILAEGELKMMMLAKLKGLAVALAVGLVGVAVAAGALPAVANDNPNAPPAPRVGPRPTLVALQPDKAKPAEPPAPKVIDNDGPVDTVALSPDGKFVVAQTRVIDENDQFKTTTPVKLWDAKTGKLVKTLYDGQHLHGVAFSADGKYVAAAVAKFDRDKVRAGDVRDAFSCDVLVWDVESGKQTATLPDSTAHAIYHVAYSPDGKYLASGGGMVAANSAPDGGEITVWDAEAGKVLWGNKEHKGAVRRLAFSADGKKLATPSDDGTIRVWDSFTGKHLKTIDTKAEKGVWSAAFSPDGKLIAASVTDGTVRVWDAGTGEPRHTFEGNQGGSVLLAGFLPDGTLVTCGSRANTDGNLKLWDVKTGKLVRALAEPNLSVQSMAIGRDGKTIAVGTWDKTLVIVPVPAEK